MKIISQSIISVALLYLIISANFLPEVLSCGMQRLLNNSQLAKHVAAFLTMYIFVTYTNAESKNIAHPLSLFKYTIITYLLFIITTRIHIYYNIPIAILLTCILLLNLLHNFVIRKRKEIRDKNDTDDIILNNSFEKYAVYNFDNIIMYFTYSIFIICGIGFIHYMIEKLYEHNFNWSWYKFIFGVNKCKRI